jgi:hypothetical protein
MKFPSLTLRASSAARSIVLPVVASQSKRLCEKYGLERIAADVRQELAGVKSSGSVTSVNFLDKFLLKKFIL